MTLKGRYWTLAWLLVFLGTALAVSGRQRVALQTAADLDARRTERRTLEARAADLSQRIRTATSLGVLDIKVARSLGLRMPDSRNSTTLVRRDAAPGAG